ncbi:MAG: hypothetical protein O7A71_00310 [Chloroflexi bacterium]|nr:hypothetical protein [Chloroflexota bacterium]
MSVEATVNVYFQPGADGDLGLRLIRAIALDSQGDPVADVTLVFTIVEGPGALGDGDEQIVMLRSNRVGQCHCYWYPVGNGADGEIRQAVVHVRSDEASVTTLEAEIVGDVA